MKIEFSHIGDGHKVVEFFGNWPSFDDFEVISMLLERSHDGSEPWPVFTVKFLAAGGNPGGTCPRACLLNMRFGGVRELKLEGFNYQNAINGLSIDGGWSSSMSRNIFKVEMIQGFGVGAVFECEEIAVVDLAPV